MPRSANDLDATYRAFIIALSRGLTGSGSRFLLLVKVGHACEDDPSSDSGFSPALLTTWSNDNDPAPY